jgi:hypothetical protein
MRPWLLLVSTFCAATACTPSRPQLQLHTPNVVLLAATSRERNQNVRRQQSESPLNRALDNVLADPVPALGLAALVAAAGPAVYRAAFNGRPRTLWWPSTSRRGSLAGARSARTVDGALDDAKTVALARALLAAWDAGSADQAESSATVEAALGLLALEFSQRGGEDAAQLRRLMRLVAAHSSGTQQTVSALRKATTAAARMAFGSGRDGNAFAISQRDGACGALLLLCQSLFPRDTLGALSEVVALEAGVRRAFFGFEGEEERGVRLRDECARRLFTLEARRVLRASGAGSGGAGAVLSTPTWRRPLDELPGLMRLAPSMFVGPLLLIVQELLQTELERALAAWLQARGRTGGRLPELSEISTEIASSSTEIASSVPSVELPAQTPAAAAMERAAFAMASSAARLARSCLELGGPSTAVASTEPQLPSGVTLSDATKAALATLPDAAKKELLEKFGALAASPGADDEEGDLAMRDCDLTARDRDLRLEKLRSVGVLSPARHRFYQAAVRVAVLEEVARVASGGVRPAAAEGTGSDDTIGLSIEDCVVLRRLLAVLPTSAAAGASAALKAAAGTVEMATVDLTSIERRLELTQQDFYPGDYRGFYGL